MSSFLNLEAFSSKHKLRFQTKMLLKVVYGRGEWLILNGNCRLLHLNTLIKGKCPTWPEGAAVDLCDIETGTLMGMHILEPWDMATPCFAEVDTQKKIMIPVAITIEKDIITSITPMLDHFATQFPEIQAQLDAMLHSKIQAGVGSGKNAKSLLIPPIKDKTKKKKNKDKKTKDADKKDRKKDHA